MECGGAAKGISLYPLRRCKIIHLVRHAQGVHNLEEAKTMKTSAQLVDAPLSPLGWKQVDMLREHVHSRGLLKRIQLVIVSPLLRTMQTAAGVFGTNPPVMVGEANNQAAGRGLNCPPFIAVELCRERIGVNTADKRRSVNEYKPEFPAIDFSLVETDEDTWWTPDVRESDQELAARGIKFFNWVWTRQEEEIAIVTHSAFLFHTLNQFGNDCHESVKAKMHQLMEGTNHAKTDYPSQEACRN